MTALESIVAPVSITTGGTTLKHFLGLGRRFGTRELLDKRNRSR
jgi:hypothetical protein